MTDRGEARQIALEALEGYEPVYCNEYRCERCDAEWTDYWSCGCDDECPHCSADISPHTSTLLNPIEPEDDEETLAQPAAQGAVAGDNR